MGEIADMMLEGEMCQTCGEILEPSLGYPGFCPACQADQAAEETYEHLKADRKADRVNCPQCGKSVHRTGLDQHIEAKHEN